jgi:hypothetical protein
MRLAGAGSLFLKGAHFAAATHHGVTRRSRRTKAAVVVTAALAAIAFAAPPASAASTATAPAAGAARALAHCPNGYMVAIGDSNVYSGWNSFRIIGHVNKSDLVRCAPGYDLGRRYTACGVSDGNGWVRLIANDSTRGWAPQACLVDQ